jgi:hypothetical protein
MGGSWLVARGSWLVMDEKIGREMSLVGTHE